MIFSNLGPTTNLQHFFNVLTPSFKYHLDYLKQILFPGQMFLMDRFFNGAFLTFGLEVIAFAERDQEDRLDPMIYIFPRMTKCTFHKFGTSGEVEKHDALCILPLNIVNEKIYIFLWFWLLLLGALSTLVVAYRLGDYYFLQIFQGFSYRCFKDFLTDISKIFLHIFKRFS